MVKEVKRPKTAVKVIRKTVEGGEGKEIKKPIQPPAFKISSIGDSSQDQYIKFLVYADYGAGKTFLVGTSSGVESMRDILLIDAESGELTLKSRGTGFPFEKIDRVRVTKYSQVARVQEYLRAHCMARENDDIDKLIELESKFKGVEVTEPKMYRTVLIDSLTEVEAYCMNSLLGISENTRLDADVNTAEWSEYKRQHSMIQRLVRGFRDLPVNLLITCSRQYTQDETKKHHYMPALTGKLAGQVQGFMDVVGYLQVGTKGESDSEVNRRLWIQPIGKFSAKCRFSAYKKPYFENPTMESILTDVGILSKKTVNTKSKEK